MKKDIVPYLVKRFLRFDKDQPFIFLSALLAFLGISLGVMVLLVAMALMNGFDNEFRKKLTVMNYPLTIVPKFYGSVNDNLLMDLESKFPKLAFSPYVQSSIMARSGSKLEGGYLFGVNFKDEAKVNSVVREALKDEEIAKFHVLVGKSLKDDFNLFTGDRLMYIFTHVEPGGLSITPKIKRFKVKSIFDSGLSAYDKAYSYTTLSSMQAMLHLPSNQYDGIHIFSEDPEQDIVKIKESLPISVTVKGEVFIVKQGYYISVSPTGQVTVKEFSPKDLKNMKKESFGAKNKRKTKQTKTKEIIANDEKGEQIDNTIEDYSDILISDATDSTISSIQETTKSLSDLLASYTMNDALYEGSYTVLTADTEVLGAIGETGIAELSIDFGADTATQSL